MSLAPRFLRPIHVHLAAAPVALAMVPPTNLNASKRVYGAILRLDATAVEAPILVGGRWNGHPLDLAAMEEMVATYNPEAQPGPIKLTHAEDQARAYGWVKALRIGDWIPPGAKKAVKTLFATLSFTDEGRQAVSSGAYRMRSLEAWPRNHPSNPTPGKWHFRALALLGAESPGCPNLSPLTLSAGDEDIETPVLVLQADTPNQGGSEPPTHGEAMTLTPEQVAKLQADAAKTPELENQLALLKAQLADQETANIQTRLDGLVTAGKLTPAQAALAKPVLLSVPTVGVVALAEGQTTTPRNALWQLLEAVNGHGLLDSKQVPHTPPAKLAAGDPKAFNVAVQKHVDAGKPYPEALELAARDIETATS